MGDETKADKEKKQQDLKQRRKQRGIEIEKIKAEMEISEMKRQK